MHKDVILDFIENFNQKKDVVNCFLYGNCYWFAQILYKRFNSSSPTIMYCNIDNHFGCRIDNIVYDITGIVTNQYDWEPWSTFATKDPLHTQRIIRDCILKLPDDTGGYYGSSFYQ